MLGDWNRDCTSSTLVDSAAAGSQADALFFSAPVSLPASGPSTATMISQNTRTAHLVRRPAGIRMIALALLMPRSPFGLGHRHAAPDARWRRLPRECGPSRHRELIGPSGRTLCCQPWTLPPGARCWRLPRLPLAMSFTLTPPVVHTAPPPS